MKVKVTHTEMVCEVRTSCGDNAVFIYFIFSAFEAESCPSVFFVTFQQPGTKFLTL